MKSKFFKSVSGFIIGILNGLLGAGGGMIAVPVLRKSGFERANAHACAIAVILPLSIFSAALYLYNGRVSLSDSYIYIPAGIVGAIIGGILLKKIPDKALRRIFALIMIWAGVRSIMR